MCKQRIYISIVNILCPVFIFAQQYDPVKAIQYAERWWNDFNTNAYHRDTAEKWRGPYLNYSNDGGDCTAFASQCLRYGGLDLSAGSNGYGNGVKSDSVIAGALELLKHLRDIQHFPHQAVIGGASKAEPSFMVPGHPAILERPDGRHSIFCVAVENGYNVYNAHSNPECHKKRSFFNNNPDSHYIHIGAIPQTYPAHCENCMKDQDETGLDCGGSCPPCADAPDNRVVAQNSLKSENYALANLSTSGTLVLKSGNAPVAFTTGTEIVLNGGFEVTLGTEFTTKTTQNRNELTRNFRKVCINIPNVFTPNGDGINDIYGVNVAGVTFVGIRIFTSLNITIKTYETDVSEDGFIALWDGGNYSTGTYYYEIAITTYEGDTRVSTGYISLLRGS
jgi:gliding motility-associated-like protein